MMLVKETLARRVQVDARDADDADVLTALVSDAAKAVGEHLSLHFVSDVTVPATAMRVRVSDAHAMLSNVDIAYYPNPQHGVQLVGGPHDGDTIAIPPEGDVAPTSITLPGLAQAPQMMSDDERPEPSPSFRYDRLGIDAATSTWIYKAGTTTV